MEAGRWVGMKQEGRICAQCSSGEVENVEHFVLRWGSVVRESGVVEANGRVSL